MTILLAIDPGKMTGVARVAYSDKEAKIISTSEVPMDIMWDSLLKYFESDAIPDKVVIEDFKITVGTGKLGSPDWSLRIIGAVEYLCWKYDIPLKKQFPSNAKAFSTNPKLRAVDLWHKGGAGHANDALRHAMLYMVKDGWRDDRLLDADND